MENNILVYDIQSLPDVDFGLTAEEILKIYQEHKIVLYDSSDNGKTPMIIPKENIKDFKFVDLSSTQIDLSKYKK